jgi:hypothetical protein
VSRYLSKDKVRLPLILDEPFANSDDERFMQLMELIQNQLSLARAQSNPDDLRGIQWTRSSVTRAIGAV